MNKETCHLMQKLDYMTEPRDMLDNWLDPDHGTTMKCHEAQHWRCPTMQKKGRRMLTQYFFPRRLLKLSRHTIGCFPLWCTTQDKIANGHTSQPMSVELGRYWADMQIQSINVFSRKIPKSKVVPNFCWQVISGRCLAETQQWGLGTNTGDKTLQQG